MKHSTVLKEGTIVTLLTSYCGGDINKDCINNNPCNHCVRMANQYVLTEDVSAKYLKEVYSNIYKEEI